MTSRQPHDRRGQGSRQAERRPHGASMRGRAPQLPARPTRCAVRRRPTPGPMRARNRRAPGRVLASSELDIRLAHLLPSPARGEVGDTSQLLQPLGGEHDRQLSHDAAARFAHRSRPSADGRSRMRVQVAQTLLDPRFADLRCSLRERVARWRSAVSGHDPSHLHGRLAGHHPKAPRVGVRSRDVSPAARRYGLNGPSQLRARNPRERYVRRLVTRS